MDLIRLLDHPDVDRLVQLSLDEDGIENDLTTKACGTDVRKATRATIIAKKETLASGFPMVGKVIRAAKLDEKLHVSCMAQEGSKLTEKAPWIIFEGNLFDLLRIERTILNFLIRMCGIATYTQQAMKQVEGTNCKILHTRKTAPGHRRTDIYSTLVGGAQMHRRSLDDAILVKENHLRAVSSYQELVDGVNRVRNQARFVEIEVTNFTELKYALLAKPDRILLDNFSLADIKRAVELFGSSVELEASGNINLENVRSYADTGVDYVSLGSLTHSAPAADLSLLFSDE